MALRRCPRVPTLAVRSSISQLGACRTRSRIQWQRLNSQTRALHNSPRHASEDEPEQDSRQPRIPLLRPGIFALSLSTAVYVSMAYWEAKKNLKPKPMLSMEDLAAALHLRQPAPQTPIEVATQTWNSIRPMPQLAIGICATNAAVMLSKFFAPSFWTALWHTPAQRANYSLLTSVFVHSGPIHLIINTMACYQFLPRVGQTRIFRQDTGHMISFYVATGVLAAYAQHVAQSVRKFGRPNPLVFIPSGGASGALFAVFGVFCAQYPHAGIGLFLIPYYLDAQYMLPAIMLFDFVGMVRGYSFVNLGHAAHLAGASLGLAYSYLDGHTNLWCPLVDFWTRRLS